MRKRSRQNTKRPPKGDILNISLVGYKSAKDIVVQYFKYDHWAMSTKEIMKQSARFTLNNEEPETKKTFACILKEIEKLGLWAFCIDISKHKKEIHFWISTKKRIKNHDIIELIMHECIHAYGVKNETTATKYAEIASLSYRIITKQMKEYLRR